MAKPLAQARVDSEEDIDDDVETVLIREVSDLVTRATGVQLGDRQYSMVQNRIKKRILALGMEDETEYLEYFRANRAHESTALVSLLTTHHTYFFREYAHFEYLEKTALPALVAAKRASGDRAIRIWSAACSRGQEVYSLSMFVGHFLAQHAPDLSYEILGTDVDPESVKTASNGVYAHKEIQEVPLRLVGKNWARGTGEIANFVKALPSIKKPCRFAVMNLLELSKAPEGRKFDLIFCRNVFIYFTPEQIKSISSCLLAALSPDGHLFIGISESLGGLQLPVTVAGTSVYRHTTAVAATKKPPSTALSTLATLSARSKTLRVLCVDDSLVIHTLMRKILSPEHGFEVVATAENGLQAAQKLKEYQGQKDLKIDLITLDIHMPIQDGLAFLTSLKGQDHPPVVMVSSVSRDDADLALRCLDAGAIDYVEKPVLANLMERGEEIRAKLKYAASSIHEKTAPLDFDRAFAKTIAVPSKPERCRRVILATLGDRARVAEFLHSLPVPHPPTLILLEGAGAGAIALQTTLTKALGSLRVRCVSGTGSDLDPSVNEIVIADARESAERLLSKQPIDAVSVLVFGQVSPALATSVKRWPKTQILLDECVKKETDHPLRSVAADIVPATSFAYLSTQFLAKGNS